MNEIQLLKKLGALPTFNGYHYLLRAIKIVKDDPMSLNAVNKSIYRVVAEEFQIKFYMVESSIRCLLKRMWEVEEERMRELSDNRWDKCPPISEFLCFVLTMPEDFSFSK